MSTFFFSVLILTDVGLTSNDSFKVVHALVCGDLMDKMKNLFVSMVFLSSINQPIIYYTSIKFIQVSINLLDTTSVTK